MRTVATDGLRALAAEMVRQAVRDVRGQAPAVRRAGWTYLRSRHCEEVLANLGIAVDDAIERIKARYSVEEVL